MSFNQDNPENRDRSISSFIFELAGEVTFQQLKKEVDPATARHLEQAVHHLEIAYEIQRAIERGSFNELLDAVHHEAGIDSKDGFELGGAG